MRFLVLGEKQKMASARRKFFMNLQDEVKIVNDYNKLEDMTSKSFSTFEYDIDFLKDTDFTGEIDKISQKILSVKNFLPSHLQFKGHLLILAHVYAFLALKVQALNNHLDAFIDLFDVPSFRILN